MPDIQDQFGNKVKVACAACIRGHRSSQCNEKHYDRIMVAVRKPGRPLTACPHAKGQSCTCSSAQVTYTIPRATAKCASGAIKAIAVSANESLVANSHVSSNARLKRTHQHRASKSGSSTPLSKVDGALKNEYFESNRQPESPFEGTPQPVSVGCCGRKPVAEEDEASSPASSTNLSVDSATNLRNTSRADSGEKNTQTSQTELQEHGHNSLSMLSTGHKAKSRNQQSLSLHDPANNGLDANGFQHGCNCGPDCSCLGCAAHPQNSTTIQYVKELYDYQADEANDSLDSFTLPSPQNTNTFGFDQTLPGYPNDPKILPPDLYFPFQLNLPGCGTGGCRCGTSCTCTGCLTHSGHNGISNNLHNPLQFDGFGIDTSRAPLMTAPSASANNWVNPLSPVASNQHTFSTPNNGFHPLIPPPQRLQQGPNFMPNINQFVMLANQRAQRFYAQNSTSMHQSGPIDPVAFQFSQPSQTPVTHGHPMNQYGISAHSTSQSPIATPTSAGPFQQGYGF